MIYENIKPHRALNILFIGDTNSCFSYKPYVYGYYTALKEMGHNVITVCTRGDIAVDSEFDYTSSIIPHLKNVNFHPDLIILAESYPVVSNFNYQTLKVQTKVPTAFISVDTAVQYEKHARIGSFFDYTFIAHEDYLPYFQQNCASKLFWLPYACDPNVHKALDLVEKTEIAFIGIAWKNPPLYKKRIYYLDALQSRYKTEFYEYYSEKQTAKVYSRSKIIFNYGPINGVNARIFEALSYGKLLLNNRTTTLNNVFRDKTHLVFYDNLPHLLQLIDFYLNHPEKRLKIGSRGQKEVWGKHTFHHRVDFLLQKIFGDSIYAT